MSSSFRDRLKSNLLITLPYLPQAMWLVLAGIFGVIGYKLFALGLQQSGRAAIGIPEWMSFRLTSAWPGLVVMVFAVVCSMMGAIRSKVPVQNSQSVPRDPLPKTADKSIMEKPPVPAELIGAHDTWFRMGVSVQRMVVVLGIVSVVSSLALTAFEPELHHLGDGNGFGTRLVAFVSAVAAGLLGTFSLVQKNRDIWGSWRRVQSALIRYKNESDYSFTKLMDEYDKAEESLGNVIIAAPTKPGPPAEG